MDFWSWLVDAVYKIALGIFVPAYNAILNIFNYLLDLLGEAWEKLKELFVRFLDALYQVFEFFAYKLASFAVDAFLQLISWALEKIVPFSSQEDFTEVINTVRSTLAGFDFFLPIHEMFALGLYLMGIYITITVLRIVFMIALRIALFMA